MERAHDDLNQTSTIAIIGMAGRFPQARNIEEFWQILCTGTECITHYTEAELITAGVDAKLVQNPNYIRARGELANIDRFDAHFFGVNPKEAELMDPQHRLLLECSWEALENAGYDSERYSGRIGVYAGESMNTYVFLNVFPYIEKVLSSGSLQAAIGNDKDSLTTMIAYKLNLRGPAITIQSSSSTSLTAVCIACQSLLNYQCDMALAGGISVGSPKKSGYLYESRGIVSPDGHCRPFDINAKGFVPGNGMGMVVLKRLQDAIDDGDSILAVIRGYAVNNDGSAKVSYGAPSVDAQAEVIMEAQAVAEISPDTIGYIEAHGTGTEMGDPIEVTALTQAFRAGTDLQNFCALGSVKGNIGHLDTAAGVVGLMKTTLALQHQLIPPSINFETPNPKMDLVNSPFYISKQLQPWIKSEFPRRAGVTSLGMGGTNAHVILEEAPPLKTSGASRPWQLVLCSAKTESALAQMGYNLAGYLETHSELNLADVAYTLQVGRRHWKYRRMVCCQDRLQAIRMIRQELSNGNPLSPPVDSQRIIFTITGSSAELAPDMSQLYLYEPYFAQAVDDCLVLFRNQWNRFITNSQNPLADLSAMVLNQPWLNGVLWFVLEYAMVQLFLKWGVSPLYLAGYDSGEICAACTAGIFPLETALQLITIQSQIRHDSAQFATAELRTRLQQLLDRQPLKSPQIPLSSISSGKQLSEQEAVNRDYWVDKAVSTNALSQCWPKETNLNEIRIEFGSGQPQTVVKSGPHPGIFTPLQPPTDGEAIQEQLLKILGQLWEKGVPIDWAGFHFNEDRRRIPLPTYPFEGQSYWLEPKSMSSSSTVAAKPKEMAQIKGKDCTELTECEKLIVEAWSEVLGFTEFGPDDNFFEIGGDSILLIKLHSLLETHFPGAITATDLFAYPTIAKLSQYLNNMRVSRNEEILPQLVPPEVNQSIDEKERIQRLLEEGKKGNLSMEEILRKLNTLGE